MSSPRRPLVGGNWKMHLTVVETTAYLARFVPALESDGPEVVLFPGFTLLPAARELGPDGSVAIGGQDLHPEPRGAHTGDVSGPQLVDVGCSWVLCGHSERRHDHGESDDLVAAKVAAATAHGLTPMICVGETADERAADRTLEVLDRQLRAAVGAAVGAGVDRYALAYEPVWAIGTGLTATPQIAQDAHRFLRRLLAEVAGETRAESCRILYGGSVNPGNAADLISQPDLDGFLVGGASLDPEKFLTIIRACGS